MNKIIYYKSSYASPERASDKELNTTIENLRNVPNLKLILDAIPYIIVILNQYRQIVFANKATLNFLHTTEEKLYGARPGEAIGCVHACELKKGGCGCTGFCKYCGAVNSIISSFTTGYDTEECHIVLKNGDIMELRASASKVSFNGETFVIFTLQDIKSEKQNALLQRIFFHDLLNTAGVIKGTFELTKSFMDTEGSKYFSLLDQEIEHLLDEINSQKQLIAAQQGILKPNKQTFLSDDFFRNIINTFNFLYKELRGGKRVKISEECDSVDLYTDPIILKRVLLNMLKNAMEAAEENEIIQASCKLENGFVRFIVRNKAYIPEDIQKQMFLRYISTKGPGRGIGTYSIKLLTEKYLGGKVSFSSTKKDGTEFVVSLPIRETEDVQ